LGIYIGDKKIGDGEPTFIVAEAGINHNGEVEIGKKLIEEAAKAGADAVKFQSYQTELFVSRTSKHYDVFKKLELSEDEFRELSKYAKKHKLIFLSTPLNLEYVDILNDIGVPAFKVASSDLTFFPLLEKIAETRKPVILSTGMSTLSEIHEAVDFLKENGAKEITLLHCVSAYPTPFEEVNLKVIPVLKNMFKVPVGYSDHTLGVEVSIAAVALGANLIEKHFTLDKNMPGPDHKLSADPEEFKNMVASIRTIESALGDGCKRVMPSEKDARIHGRRSIVAKIPLKAGDLLTKDRIAYKRPGTGIETKFLNLILNRKLKKNKNADDVITWDDLLGG